MTSRPSFSFIIPTYNRADIICEALESIRLEQVRTDFELEVLVSDDHSRDDTQVVIAQWCEDKQLNWVHYQRLGTKAGAGAARNNALDRAKGDIVVFLDSDDQLLPGALTHIKACFDMHGDMDIYFGAILKKSGKQGALPPDTAQKRLLDFEQFVKLKGVGEYLPICRNGVLQGGQPLRFCEDITGFESILWLRLLRQGAKLWIEPHPVRLYDDLRTDRLCHPLNLGKDSQRLASGFLKLFQEFGDEIESLQSNYWAALLFRLIVYNKLAGQWNSGLKARLSHQIARAPLKVRLIVWLPGGVLQFAYPLINRFRNTRLVQRLK